MLHCCDVPASRGKPDRQFSLSTCPHTATTISVRLVASPSSAVIPLRPARPNGNPTLSLTQSIFAVFIGLRVVLKRSFALAGKFKAVVINSGSYTETITGGDFNPTIPAKLQLSRKDDQVLSSCINRFQNLIVWSTKLSAVIIQPDNVINTVDFIIPVKVAVGNVANTFAIVVQPNNVINPVNFIIPVGITGFSRRG